jgi:sugar (pentulose or hexulose) kinase
MPRSQLVAGIDLATADVRVTVAGGDGRVRATGSAPLPPPEHPRPGWSEQDPAAWWPAVVRCLREATRGLDDPVVAVAVAATSGTVVLADSDRRPVGTALLYDDRRAAAPDRWSRMLERPGADRVAAHAWHASDLVVSRLTGEVPPTDWTHALKTGFDPERREWATAEPGAARRPVVQAPASAAGQVCAAASEETGLPAGCQVRLGMTDASAAQLAAGADRPGRFVTVVGTTLVVKGATEARIDDAASGVYSHRHPDGWWLPGGASNTGGASLTARFPDRDLAALDGPAARHGPATVVCYPLPGHGERFPFTSDGAEETWTGSPDGEVDAYRAVLEGVAFLERLGYEHLRALGATVTPPLRSAGRGSRSGVWTAIRATVLGMPIVRPPSADTAFGACVLAAAGTIHPDLTAAADAMVGRPGAPVEPVAGEAGRLEEGYGRFVDLLTGKGWLTWRN